MSCNRYIDYLSTKCKLDAVLFRIFFRSKSSYFHSREKHVITQYKIFVNL